MVLVLIIGLLYGKIIEKSTRQRTIKTLTITKKYD